MSEVPMGGTPRRWRAEHWSIDKALAEVDRLRAALAERDATIAAQAERIAEVVQYATLRDERIGRFEAFAKQYRWTMNRKHMNAIEAAAEFSSCDRLCDESMEP